MRHKLETTALHMSWLSYPLHIIDFSGSMWGKSGVVTYGPFSWDLSGFSARGWGLCGCPNETLIHLKLSEHGLS